MVFEHLFPDSLLERKHWTAFVLAVIYSTISIILARLLFPANSGIVSVVFVSIFPLPYFESVLKRDELVERKESEWKFRHLLQDNAEAIKTYFFLFFGIYLSFMMYSFLAPSFGFDPGTVFREQLSLEGLHGGALFSFGTFFTIVLNNWWVLLACFMLALVAGDGAVFFIAWNASTWGTVFGYRAFEAGLHTGQSALWALIIIVVITLPHLILEGGAYILAALAGGIISDEIVEKVDEVKRFVLYFLSAVLLYAVLYMLLRTLLANSPVILGLLAIVLALGMLHAMHYIFDSPLDRKIFQFNFYMFALAVGLFIIGATVETLVLMNATPLREVYAAAFGG